MISKLGDWLSDKAKRYVPDPFVLAIGLTLMVFLLALPRADWNPMTVVNQWVDGKGGGKGFWNLLKFAMQMCMILLTGYALAETKLARAVIGRLARVPQRTGSAVILVSLVAMSMALLNWGLGLIVGALLAREVGRIARLENRPIHYPIVCAAGYTGLGVWHAGFSGSAPLAAADSAQLVKMLGPETAQQIGPLDLTATIGSPLNLTVIVLCLIVIPLTLFLLVPKDDALMEEAPDQLTPTLDATLEENTPANVLNNAFWVVCIPAFLGLSWCVNWLMSVGLSSLKFNVINLFMLSLGLLLHGSVRSYVQSIDRAVKSCAGIILQYPFYAGIMGIMAASGLVGDIGGWLAGLGPSALAVSTFYSAGLVNLVVPSGGGQWVVQGPIVMQAALAAKAEPSVILMALCYGDQWTNLIQPFWALPLLGICQVRVSAIIGYTAVLLIASQVCFLLPLILFS
jgi:short-chain fatty acids transporter